MKKKRCLGILGVIVGVIIFTCTLSGCNKQITDTTYSFKVILSLPNGDIVEGKITSWIEYDDENQIQVKINGKTYLVHSSNIVFINE